MDDSDRVHKPDVRAFVGAEEISALPRETNASNLVEKGGCGFEAIAIATGVAGASDACFGTIGVDSPDGALRWVARGAVSDVNEFIERIDVEIAEFDKAGGHGQEYARERFPKDGSVGVVDETFVRADPEAAADTEAGVRIGIIDDGGHEAIGPDAADATVARVVNRGSRRA